MKRVFSVLLLLCLLLSVIPVQSLAYYEDGPYNIWGLGGDYDLVTVTPSSQYAGKPVTIAPKAGYKITFLEVYPSDGDPLTLTGDSSGYSFTMPEGKVEFCVTVETSDGSAVKHTVSVITGYNANPVADKQAAAPGEVVTITPNPSAGMVFDSLQVEYHTEEGYERYILTKEPFFTVPDRLQAGSNLVVQVNYKADSSGGNTGDNTGGNTGDNTNDNNGGNTDNDDDDNTGGGNISTGLNFSYGYDVYRSPAYPKKGGTFTVYNFAKPLDANGSTRIENAAEWKLTDAGKFSSFKDTAANTTGIASVVNSTAYNYGVSADNLTVYKLTRNDALITYGVLVMHNPTENVAMFIGGNYGGGAGYFFANVAQSGTKDYDVTSDASDTADESNIRHITDAEGNAFNADIGLSDAEVLNMLVTDEERASGENITVRLVVDPLADAAVPATDKSAIEAFAGTDTLAAYLDIRLLKKVGDAAEFTISNTYPKKVPITMEVDAGVIPANAGRVYIVYYHDNAAKSLDVTYNAATRSLTFDAYEFSTYALAYEIGGAGSNGGTLDNVPKTGEASGLSGWILMALCCTAMLACVCVYDRKRAR